MEGPWVKGVGPISRRAGRLQQEGARQPAFPGSTRNPTPFLNAQQLGGSQAPSSG